MDSFGLSTTISKGWITKHESSGVSTVTVLRQVRDIEKDGIRTIHENYLQAGEAIEGVTGSLTKLSTVPIETNAQFEVPNPQRGFVENP